MLAADAGNRDSIKFVLDDARDIVKVFNRNSRPNALLREQQDQHRVRSGLAMDCVTRFSSKYSMLHSVLVNKEALKSTVVLDSFPLSEARYVPVLFYAPMNEGSNSNSTVIALLMSNPVQFSLTAFLKHLINVFLLQQVH